MAKRALGTGATVVGRLRKDAELRGMVPPHRGGRGRPRKYGTRKISLAKRAGQQRGWQALERRGRRSPDAAGTPVGLDMFQWLCWNCADG
jgi:hypothetical protein